MVHDVWVEVDLAALQHNFAQVRSVVPSSTRIMAVVKGNGFGHGLIEPARAFVEAGADMVAVTRIEEALPLRQAGINCPVLLFAPVQPDNAQGAIEADLDMTVCDITLAETISDAAQAIDKTARIWIKVDTGMNRLGALPDKALSLIERAAALPKVTIAGVYTHFASAMQHNLANTRRQLKTFRRVLDSLPKSSVDCGLASAANSAAILRLPESHLDIIRPGTILYGQYPSAFVPRSLDLRSAWKLKARICQVRDLPKGSSIGYEGDFRTQRDTRAAIIPLGYSDGFTMVSEGQIYRQNMIRFALKRACRRLSVEVGGSRAPVIGRVAMQMTILDVTDLENVKVGDEVTVPALRIPTNPLIPRVYIK